MKIEKPNITFVSCFLFETFPFNLMSQTQVRMAPPLYLSSSKPNGKNLRIKARNDSSGCFSRSNSIDAKCPITQTLITSLTILFKNQNWLSLSSVSKILSVET